MLTKEERAAIAERAVSFNKCSFGYSGIYRRLLGRDVPSNTSIKEDDKVILDRIIDLCDTSNMIELPLDKDGEVIHIGDTVFDNYDNEWRVNGIDFKSNGVLIDVFLDGEWTKSLPSQLTHKQPATIQDLSERMQSVLEDYSFSININLHTELVSIADQLKELAGKDE